MLNNASLRGGCHAFVALRFACQIIIISPIELGLVKNVFVRLSNIDVMYIALKINSLSVRVSVIHRGDMKCWSSQSGAGYLLWLFLAL